MIEIKTFDFPLNSFIKGWILPEKFIDNLNIFFDDNFHLSKPGLTGKEVNKDIKDSLDFNVHQGDFKGIIGEYRNFLQICLDDYVKTYEMANDIQPYNINEHFNFQHYNIGGGFKKWHYENNGMEKNHKRVLVFMTYLNNVEDGGTEFKYQNLTVPAKKGLTLIWPVYWTHTHRGQISNTKEKRIITGWYSYNE